MLKARSIVFDEVLDQAFQVFPSDKVDELQHGRVDQVVFVFMLAEQEEDRHKKVVSADVSEVELILASHKSPEHPQSACGRWAKAVVE